ncbi:GlxA family transcriptional regulator [Crenobacter cavernae]|uniref:GlxA family transcriptional regulator n=1 Tax=Crenobacter cavernae TaxID=2290923 RepID=A0ABY0FIP2_9NEIS|nr:GlxA family transcriptional regulator [Crenobacter cavernae]RXZ45407.1 GlxA family transcriptional regulator [Crenobacter cavernae]
MAQPPASKPQRIGFLMLPNASMADYAVASEALIRANEIAEKKLYDILTLSLTGETVTFNNRLACPVDLPLGYAPKLDLLFVLADDLDLKLPLDALISGIQAQNPDRLTLVGLGAGSYWMARAGYLHGYRATIHWQEISRFTDEFQDIVVTSNLYEIDRNRHSCAGGAATFDYLLHYLSTQHGADLAGLLCERFSMERIRPSSERQRIPLATRIGNSQPKLTDAVSLMEANIEEPLSTDDIAYYVGVSRRQLERLFKQYLNTVPSKYYLELRLNRARQLLQQTSKSIVQIGLACGFSSGPHFSSSYRNHFNTTPREERAKRLNAPRA